MTKRTYKDYVTDEYRDGAAWEGLDFVANKAGLAFNATAGVSAGLAAAGALGITTVVGLSGVGLLAVAGAAAVGYAAGSIISNFLKNASYVATHKSAKSMTAGDKVEALSSAFVEGVKESWDTGVSLVKSVWNLFGGSNIKK
jgi:predicted butyrate kinase (DUF1464 family)